MFRFFVQVSIRATLCTQKVSFQAGFEPVKNVQAAVANALKEIPVQDFQASYDAWQNRWQRCTDAQGCYFEEILSVCTHIFN